jgi:hypothetical protein
MFLKILPSLGATTSLLTLTRGLPQVTPVYLDRFNESAATRALVRKPDLK